MCCLLILSHKTMLQRESVCDPPPPPPHLTHPQPPNQPQPPNPNPRTPPTDILSRDWLQWLTLDDEWSNCHVASTLLYRTTNAHFRSPRGVNVILRSTISIYCKLQRGGENGTKTRVLTDETHHIPRPVGHAIIFGRILTALSQDTTATEKVKCFTIFNDLLYYYLI